MHYLLLMLFGHRRQILAGLLLGGGLIMGTAKAMPQVPKEHRNEQAAQRLHDWQSLIAQSMHLSDAEKLKAVNAFFNQHVRFGEDQELWGQLDYWASPLETLELGAGDCEDFAIAKYFTLRLLGTSEHSLRLVYTTLVSTKQAHMVLGFWPGSGTTPLVLDNLNLEILPIAQRLDLQMQFAFGPTHLYRFEQTSLQVAGNTELLPNWQVLMTRMKREGTGKVSL
ncbi:transglutaminase-like cysteine peptidase [Pseudomonas sp. MMS21-TM103]|uniref:transglutaminase-like cysteine peptidase n=1 Tax=Pseudomonas sp. TaxID=306 RepID=UPI00260323D7|nr:transglutaminase-like cysteine peptidase [Pseudomonas sp.]MCG4453378.1 transglutaminase-like cysteine peptidase [Pseudomonas sp. MMS21 TM103]